MRFGINLRGDLAKLDDTEIAARYETLVAEKEANIRSLAFIQQNKLAYRLGRGCSAAGCFMPASSIGSKPCSSDS